MKTILLCGYRPQSETGIALGTETNPEGVTLLDRRIDTLKQMGMEIICVLAGSEAELQLRKCKRLVDTDLVFDTHDAEANLATNLRSGLKATNKSPCFVLPVDIPVPPADVWRALMEESRRIGTFSDAAVIQAVDAQGAPCHFGFPLFMTRHAYKVLLDIQNFTKLQDPRLKYQQVVFQAEADLATNHKPL